MKNIIPRNHRKVFTTNNHSDEILNSIKSDIQSIEGIENVVFLKAIFPKEFFVETNKEVVEDDINAISSKWGLVLKPKGVYKM